MSIDHTIKAQEIVADLLSGMRDSELMAKYGISVQEFDLLLSHLVDSGLVTKTTLELSDSQIVRAFVDSREDVTELDRRRPRLGAQRPLATGQQQEVGPPRGRRTLRAAEVVRDIRLKMTDQQIMEKYRLSRRGLESLFEKLLAAKLITPQDFDWRPVGYDDTVVLDVQHLDDN